MANLSQEVQPACKPFAKIIEKFLFSYDFLTVLDDFLNMMIFNFSMNDPSFKRIRDDGMKKYKEREHDMFNQMFKIFIECHDDFQKGKTEAHTCASRDLVNPWLDILGDVSEKITSKSKKQSLGQILTPSTIVDFMVKSTLEQVEEANKDKVWEPRTVLDPATGTGRFLIAANSQEPRNLHFGVDIDPLMCKAATVNLMIHGAQGEIIQKNFLMPARSDYQRGYAIGRLPGIPICAIKPIGINESVCIQLSLNAEIRNMKEAAEKKVKEQKQLSIL